MCMKHLIVLSAVFILITSCSEESSLFDPTYFGEGFKGITFTLEGGPEPIKVDPSDWCYYNPGNIDPGGGLPLGFSFGAAFPNPTYLGGYTTVPFTIPQSTAVYIYVINNQYQVVAVLVNEVLNAGSYQIQFDTNSIGATGVYRVVFETENVSCKGDIWIKSK